MDLKYLSTVLLIAAIFTLSISCSSASVQKQGASIGSATMSQDGTIILDLRAEDKGKTVMGDARIKYPPDHPEYEEVLRHLGGLKKGETKPCPAWQE